MSDILKCPFCQQELSYMDTIDGGFEIFSCDCASGIWLFGNDKMWQELIHTKELFDIECAEHEMCHTQMLKTTEKLEHPDSPDEDDAIQEVIHTDPYTKQRKCLCKLCWFWNDDKADKVIGILTGVFDEADRPFERNLDQTLYKHCEQVKPDDDIIYKGE